MAPLAAWMVGDGLLSVWRTGLELDKMPSLIERMLLTASLWSVRAQPFGALAGILITPALTLVAAWLLRPTRSKPPLTLEVVPWLFVWAGSLAAVVLIIWSGRTPSMALLLLWSASLGQALALAVAYRVQLVLHEDGVSTVPGSAVLWVGVAAQLIVQGAWLVALAVPGWAEWRVSARRRRTRS
jgi:hypothetical protein